MKNIGYGYDKYRYRKPSNASPAQIKMFLAAALGGLWLAFWMSNSADKAIKQEDK